MNNHQVFLPSRDFSEEILQASKPLVTENNKATTHAPQATKQQRGGLTFFFLDALGLGCCTRAFSSCGKQGLLCAAVRRLLIAVASLVAEHRP